MECHFEIIQKVRKNLIAPCSGTKSTGNLAQGIFSWNLAQGMWAEKHSG